MCCSCTPTIVPLCTNIGLIETSPTIISDYQMRLSISVRRLLTRLGHREHEVMLDLSSGTWFVNGNTPSRCLAHRGRQVTRRTHGAHPSLALWVWQAHLASREGIVCVSVPVHSARGSIAPFLCSKVVPAMTSHRTTTSHRAASCKMAYPTRAVKPHR